MMTAATVSIEIKIITKLGSKVFCFVFTCCCCGSAQIQIQPHTRTKIFDSVYCRTSFKWCLNALLIFQSLYRMTQLNFLFKFGQIMKEIIKTGVILLKCTFIYLPLYVYIFQRNNEQKKQTNNNRQQKLRKHISTNIIYKIKRPKNAMVQAI